MDAKAEANSLFDDPRYVPQDHLVREPGTVQDNEPPQDRYIAFGLETDPVQIQIIDEYGIIYQPSCLHLEGVVLITSHWLGLAFNRMGFIVHGQELHKLLTPLKSLKVGWLHAYRADTHFIAFDAQDQTAELDVYGVIVTSITRYPVDQYEVHLTDMLNQHRGETPAARKKNAY